MTRPKCFAPGRTPGWVLGLMVLLVVGFLLSALMAPGSNLAFDNEPVGDFSSDWALLDQTGQPDAQHSSLTLPVKLSSTETTRIMKIIPGQMPNPAVLGFRSTQQRVRVFCDGALLYEYGYDAAPLFGRSPGSGWHLVRLPRDCEGKELVLELTSPYPFYQGNISRIEVGSKAALIISLLRRYSFALLLTLMISGSGVVMLAAYFWVIRKSGAGKETLYLGLFALFISMWLFGESRLTQFFSIPPVVNLYYTFVAMLATPIPLCYYIAGGRSPIGQRILRIAARCLTVLLVVSILLQASGLLDFIQQLFLIHGCFILCAVLMLSVVIFDCVRHPTAEQIQLLVSLAILVIFFLFETALLYLGAHSVGGMMRAGVLVFIAMQAQTAFKNASQIIRLSRLASIDALTGCLNRTAYHQRMAELQDSRGIGVIIADINDLKQINDNYGHEIGDDAIVRCANCFSEAFSAYGRCFRIGGDEFAMLGKDLTLDRLQAAYSRFEALNQTESGKTSYPFLVSCGYALFDPEGDQSINDTVCRADAMMYQNKRRSKQVDDALQASCQVTPH